VTHHIYSQVGLSPLTCYIDSNLDLNDIRIFDATELTDGKIFGQTIAEAEYDYRFAEIIVFIFNSFPSRKKNIK
jgi:hypothetical protein